MKLDRLGWAVRKTYRIHGVRVDVRTTSERFGSWMSRALAAYETGGRGEAELSVVVGDEGDPKDIHTLYRGISPVIRTMRVPVLGRALLQELEALSLSDRDDTVFLYATLLVIDGVHALIPSYLAPYLARSRRQIERLGIAMSLGPAVAVDRSGGVGPVPGRLVLPPEATAWLRGRADPTVAQMPGGGGRTIDAVCWFGQDMEEPHRQVSRGRALFLLASESANLRRAPAAVLHALGQLVTGAACMELRGDTPRSMILALADALGAAGSPTQVRELRPR